MNRQKITKRFLIVIFCIYFVKNIAFSSINTISPIIQEIVIKISSHPVVLSLHDKLTNIPIENKLNIMYMTYTIRRMYYNLALSQDTMIRILEKIGWNEWNQMDYFNVFVFITAFYALFMDMNTKYKQNIKKMKDNGIICNKKIYSTQMILFIIYTMFFRDVENVF
jgi:hypothetical protein